MDKPFRAYNGQDSYVFVSYSHKESSIVYPELIWLRDCGFNIWYDEGIEAGKEWNEVLADRIEGAKLFLYFVTPESVESQNCRNEVNFALGKEVPTLAVHLKKTELPGGLSLSLSNRQAILKHDMADGEYREKLRNRLAAYLEQSAIAAPFAVKRNHLWTGVAAAVALVLGVLVYSQLGTTGSNSAMEREVDIRGRPFEWSSAFSVVVLPFEHVASDAEAAAIANGLSDVVVQQLTRRRSCALDSVCGTLKVSSAGSSQNIAETARENNANYVLRGNIQRDGQTVQIRAQLVGADNSSVWSENYTRTLGETGVFALQSEIAKSVAELSAVWLGFDLLEAHVLDHPGFVSIKPEAREYYLKAREQSLLSNTGEGGDDRILMRYLERAVEIDPEFALAYLFLSETYTYQSGGMSVADATTGALAYVDKAIELNPTDPQNLLQGGQLNMLLALDYRKADVLLSQGMDQNPDWGWFPAQLAMIAFREGRTPTALKLMSMAEKIPFRFEQANFEYNNAWLLYLGGFYERSLVVSARGLALASGGSARADLLSIQWSALIEMDRIDEARSLIEEGWALDGDAVPESYVAAFVGTGQEVRARAVMETLEQTSANQYFLATAHLSLGDEDAAIQAIDTALQDHNSLIVDTLKFDRFWDPLRCDPRFVSALARLAELETLTDAGERAKAARGENNIQCE